MTSGNCAGRGFTPVISHLKFKFSSDFMAVFQPVGADFVKRTQDQDFSPLHSLLSLLSSAFKMESGVKAQKNF
jgi:uncharacterized protein (DUF1919 family)